MILASRSRIRLLIKLLILWLSALPLVAPASSALTQAQPAIPNIPDNPYGVNVFLQNEVEQWKIEKTLQMIAEANVPWVKQEFPWQEIEFKKGYFYDDKWQKSSWEKYDNIVALASKYNLSIIARIDRAPDWAKKDAPADAPIKSYQDLADFINAFLDHYNGKIKYVQVWNEPNLSAEWLPGKPADPAGYTAMLKAVYPAVKARHPEAVILSAPLAMTTEQTSSRGNMNEIDYWKGMYEAGAKDNFDIASANGYGLDRPPDDPPDPKVLNFRRVELLRDVMTQNGDEAKPVWFNEYGWNASPDTLSEEQKNYWRRVTPQQQAEWTVAGVQYARQHWPWAGVISIWYFRQVGDIPPDQAEYYFEMVDPSFNPLPIYNAVKTDASKYPGPAVQVSGTPVTQPTATSAASPPPADSPTAPVLSPTAGATATTQATVQPTAQAATLTPTSTPTPPIVAGSSSPNLALYIIGGLLVLAGLAGLAYYVAKGRGTSVTRSR